MHDLKIPIGKVTNTLLSIHYILNILFKLYIYIYTYILHYHFNNPPYTPTSHILLFFLVLNSCKWNKMIVFKK